MDELADMYRTKLKEMYDTPPSTFSAFTDPFNVQKPASWAAYNELGGKGEAGGDTDALRHLLGAATLTKRQGPFYAEGALSWHESPKIPDYFFGGSAQRPADRWMDEHNNKIGIEIGRKAKTYDEAFEMAKQAIKDKKVRYVDQYVAPPTKPSAPKRDYVDETINSATDLIRNLFSRK
jgi:hypothetical protein